MGVFRNLPYRLQVPLPLPNQIVINEIVTGYLQPQILNTEHVISLLARSLGVLQAFLCLQRAILDGSGCIYLFILCPAQPRLYIFVSHAHACHTGECCLMPNLALSLDVAVQGIGERQMQCSDINEYCLHKVCP